MATRKSDDEAMKRRVAQRVLLAMAYNRETFKDKVEEHVSGALLEFYKATLATKLGYKNDHWSDHWFKEVYTLLDRNLVTVLSHEIRGFKDRRKALDEILGVLKKKEPAYRGIAERVILKDYKLKKLNVKIEDEDAAAFWKRVEDAVEISLG